MRDKQSVPHLGETGKWLSNVRTECFRYLKLILKCNSWCVYMLRWDLWETVSHEGGAIMSGIDALIGPDTDDPFLCHVRDTEVAVCTKEPLPGPHYVSTELGLKPSRALRY